RDRWELLDFWERGNSARADERAKVASSAREVVENGLVELTHLDPERVVLEGGHVRLTRSQATRLALVVRELAANPVEHGSRTSPQGRVTVKWRASANGSRWLRVEWMENGVARFVVPETLGFGTRLIAQLVQNYVRQFSVGGMACTFELGLNS